MYRSLLTGIVLIAVCGTQAGCLEAMLRDRPRPYSARTASAYPTESPLYSPVARAKVKSYLDRLGKVAPPPDAAAQRRPEPYHPAPMPLLPRPLSDWTGKRTDPYGFNAPTRHVTIPQASATIAMPPPSTPGTTAPSAAAPSSPPAPADDAMTDSIARMQAKAEANPTDINLQRQLRMLLLAAGRDEEALQPIAALGEAENQKIAAALRVMMAVRDGDPLGAGEAAKVLAALETLRKQFEPSVDLDLTIPTTKLCRWVKGYGVYETFATNTFPAGRSEPVIVYCELQNFAATADAAGMFHTKLSMTVGLYDAAGGSAQPAKTVKDIDDISANSRTDFFLTRVFFLAGTLAPGKYTMKVTIEDVLANKIATTTMPITIE